MAGRSSEAAELSPMARNPSGGGREVVVVFFMERK